MLTHHLPIIIAQLDTQTEIIVRCIPGFITLLVGIMALRFQRNQAEQNRKQSKDHFEASKVIAEDQAHIAAEKLRLDLFEKRFAVALHFEAIHIMLMSSGEPTDEIREMLRKLLNKTTYLFGDDVKDLAETAWDRFHRWRHLQHQIGRGRHNLSLQQWNDINDEHGSISLFFAGCGVDPFRDTLRAAFSRYIGFREP